MKNSTHILYISLFLVVLAFLGIFEAIVELKNKKQVQSVSVVYDTFITPLERSKNIQKQSLIIDSLWKELQKGNISIEEKAELLDEQFYKLQDVSVLLGTINRYLTDTTIDECKVIGKIRSNIEQRVSAEDSASTVASISKLTEQYNNLKLSEPNSFINATKTISKAFVEYTVFNSKYLRGYESDMEKSSVISQFGRKLMQIVQYKTLGDLGEKVVSGKDKWLFYDKDVQYLIKPWVLNTNYDITYNPNYKRLDSPSDSILEFKKQLDKKGIDLLVVVIPSKGSVYPELLSGKNVKVHRNTQTFVDELKERNVEVVDIYNTFSELKKEGDDLYLKNDTHWKNKGLHAAAEVVAKKIKSYPWYTSEREQTEYMQESVWVDRSGDLLEMSQLDGTTMFNYTVTFPKEKTLSQQIVEVLRDSAGNIVKKRPYRDELRTSQVLLLGDSFSRIFQTDAPTSAGWISHIAYFLKQPIATIVSNGGASTLVREKLARNSKLLSGKKLVIWEFIERDLRYGENGWKHVEL